MTRTTIAIALTTALAAALLSGCGGSGDPSASGSSMPNVEPAPSSSASSPAPSPSSSSAPSSPASSAKPSGSVEMAGAPGVPKAARHHTKAGAEAFVRHYVDLINQTGTRPKSGRLEPLATNNCESCGNHASNVRSLISSDRHYSGKLFEVVETAAVTRSPKRQVVFADIIQRRTKILDSNGTVVDSIGRDKATLVFRVNWTSGGWRLSEIEVARYGTRS